MKLDLELCDQIRQERIFETDRSTLRKATGDFLEKASATTAKLIKTLISLEVKMGNNRFYSLAVRIQIGSKAAEENVVKLDTEKNSKDEQEKEK